jgi:glycosyltransferase involved in cell wall biosynthesis
MIDRETWQGVKGLAEDLLNSKAEDMDLALKVRATGKKIICVPGSVVTIARGDAARSEPSGLCTEFKRRWTDTLRDYREERKTARKSLSSRESRVLFIDQRIPHADADAGSYAAVQEMRLFQALGFRVTFLPMDLAFSGQHTRALERMGVEVIHAPFAMSVPDALKERVTEFNVVYVTRHHVARAVLPFIRKYNPDCKIVFNNADLHFLRELRVALAEKNGELLRLSKLTRDRELEVMKHCDLTITYSDVEQAVIQSHNLDETTLGKAPWVVQLANNVPPMQSRTDLGFLGSFGHRPNVDAVRFFATAVMPILRGALPRVQFNIYGSQITGEIEALQCADIVVKGQVADLAEVFDGMRLFVAPLTAGAGLKGKVLNAMAFGVPTVLSPTAAEGIGGMDGVHYCLADTAAEWVAAIGSVYNDKTKWEKISNNARELVDSRYSFEHGVHTLRRSLESIGIFPPRQPQALRCRSPLPPLEQVA